jgi:hypothetical protein
MAAKPLRIAAPPTRCFASASKKGATAMMICPKCSQLAEPDMGAIAGETVYHCKSCDLYTVQNGSKWVEGGPYLIFVRGFRGASTRR